MKTTLNMSNRNHVAKEYEWWTLLRKIRLYAIRDERSRRALKTLIYLCAAVMTILLVHIDMNGKLLLFMNFLRTNRSMYGYVVNRSMPFLLFWTSFRWWRFVLNALISSMTLPKVVEIVSLRFCWESLAIQKWNSFDTDRCRVTRSLSNRMKLFVLLFSVSE